MCTVHPLKKRPLKTIPLDLSMKKKPKTPEIDMSSLLFPTQPSQEVLPQFLPLEIQVQLALLSQQLYLGLIANSKATSSPTLNPILSIPTLISPVREDSKRVESIVSSSVIEERRRPVYAKGALALIDDKRCEANARERNRVQHLGVQFDRLRSLLPVEEQRLSKLTILRLARAYIEYLSVLANSDSVAEIDTASIKFRQMIYKELQPRR